MSESPTQDRPEFEYEGFFTGYICPECGHNDYVEGDARGDEIECHGCGLRGMIARA